MKKIAHSQRKMFDLSRVLQLDTYMSIRAMASCRVTLMALALSCSLGLMAQENGNASRPLVKITGVKSDLVDAPSLGNSSGNTSPSTGNKPFLSGATDKWLKVEFSYEVNPPVGNFLDEVQFRVWIEGRDTQDPQAQSQEGIAMALTGSVTYVNLSKTQPGSLNYGVFYVHPDTLNRYMGAHGATDFTTKFDAHVEASVSGQLISQADRNTNEVDPNWFRALKAINGFVYNKDQSPFLLSDTGRYPAIKLKNSEQ